MFNNKKGQVIFFLIMMAIVISFVAFALTKPLKDSIDITMNASNMNCTNPAISDVDNATCILIDLSLPYLIGIILSVGIGLIYGKKDISGIFVSIAVFLVTILLVSPLKAMINTFRGTDFLSCADTTISMGAKLTCIIVDAWLFWLVAVALAAGASFLISKKEKKQQ